MIGRLEFSVTDQPFDVLVGMLSLRVQQGKVFRESHILQLQAVLSFMRAWIWL